MNRYLILVSVLGASFLLAESKEEGKSKGFKRANLCSSSVEENCNLCCHLWHLDIGLLYEQPWISDMGAGTVSYNTTIYQNHLEDGYENAESYFLEDCFNYSLGLTAQVGYIMEHDRWFLLANFNYLSASLFKSYEDSNAYYSLIGFYNDQVIEPYFQYGNIFESLSHKASVNIYDLNVELTKGSFLSNCFYLEPFFGVKALWYNANQVRKFYKPTVFISNDVYQQASIKYKSWGVGPVFGINSEYFLVHWLSVFIDSEIAVLYGGIDSTNVSLFVDPTINNNTHGTSTFHQKFNQPYFLPVRSILGLKVSKTFSNDQYFFALKIGYDVRYIIVDSGLNGDVSGGIGRNSSTNFVPKNGYNIGANGLYTDLVWNF
jgi:hypothetical protein